ncbi:leucyl aminopeptidase [Nitzschia inconspicua]|uniref:Leucyl aminopeptidase n=1 Tax=Nitzschia inconspicua TaxID=303405 RepID=A0A9K3LG02_9STRA|nr:leucyl aminopeptidase [Nitzschia inconspicua]
MKFSSSISAATAPTSRRLAKGGLAMALATTSQLVVPAYVSRHLAVTAFSSSFQVQQARAISSTTQLGMSSKMDQSFVTWSFDEPCKTMSWSPLSSASLMVESKSDEWDEDADLVFVGVFSPKKDKNKEQEEDDGDETEDEEPTVTLSGGAKDLDDKLGGALSNIMSENAKAFKNGAKAGSTTPTLRVFADGKAKRYIVVGLGSPPDEGKAFEGVGSAVGKALASKCDAEKKVATAKFLLPSSVAADEACMKDLSATFYSTLYVDNRFRTGKKVKTPAEDLKSLSLITDGDSPSGLETALEAGSKLATGVCMTKDIVNAPHNVLNSVSLADTAKRLAEESGGSLKCTILGKKECEERGMGAYLGVARASETEPQFIHITYTPQGDVKKKVGVIGKGLLFDTGGYNIKTSMMELMKFDCGGAAAVLGAARAVGALKPPGVECHFVVAACENMISDKGVVPSDILTASNGKTIEVLNTDAEGRLTLADALVYCDKELDCESIIELSTLTGACMVALGKSVCGVWTDNDDLAEELKDVCKVTEEKAWRMPLEKSYNELLESKIADIKNIGTRYGGSITAALFLQNFVSKKKPFAHLDIAGPVWDDKTGATGYGAKLVTEWVRRQGE